MEATTEEGEVTCVVLFHLFYLATHRRTRNSHASGACAAVMCWVNESTQEFVHNLNTWMRLQTVTIPGSTEGTKRQRIRLPPTHWRVTMAWARSCGDNWKTEVGSLTLQKQRFMYVWLGLWLLWGSYGVLKSVQNSLVVFQPGKVWKKFFWSVSVEKGNNFPDLIFRHSFLMALFF